MCRATNLRQKLTKYEGVVMVLENLRNGGLN